ncbi:DUF3300 domain-containing protein [Alteromonas sp. M12]|uniref:DUF3300 domain-containing protein n=1 Tax=Alteromonas sp. M12 TaxID=3135644 RepID=UPI00319E905B
MKSSTKYVLVYLTLISLTVMLAVNLAQAQETQNVIAIETNSDTDIDESAQESAYLLDQAELDQMLAPIALYPDTVLSHILVASTYPLEVVQAARWREKNQSLSEQEVMDATAEEDWDPSVKALVPFHQLLQQITEDLNWLQDLGDAFLINEEQVLSSVQNLRQKAYAQGSLENSEYIEVVEEDNDILIQPASTEIVYVPYYDTRVVYGSWWWHDYPPIYWHRPAHFYIHAGLYWSPRVYVRHNLFWGGFNWRNRYIVVNHRYPYRNGRRDDGVRRVSSSEYQRWQHNPTHRRGVRYDAHTPKVVYRQQNRNDNKRVISSEGKSRVLDKSRPVQVRQNIKTVKTSTKAQQTQQRLQTKSNRVNDYSNKNDKSSQRQRVERDKTEQKNVRQVSAQSRNNVVQRSPKDLQQNAANVQRNSNNITSDKASAQRNTGNVSRDKVSSANRSSSKSNNASKQGYSNKQSQGAQRSTRSYSTNRATTPRSSNRPAQKQSHRGNTKER